MAQTQTPPAERASLELDRAARWLRANAVLLAGLLLIAVPLANTALRQPRRSATPARADDARIMAAPSASLYSALLPAAIGGFAAMAITALTAVPVAASGAKGGARLRHLAVTAAARAVFSLPWLIPALLVTVHADPPGADAFAAHADTPFGRLGSLVLLSGIWNAQTVLSRELSGPAPGQQTVLDRLLDVLLVLAMRACLEQSPTAPRWYQTSRDPRLNPALHAIHAEAGHPWTVPEPASLSGLSRPASARNFERSLGARASPAAVSEPGRPGPCE